MLIQCIFVNGTHIVSEFVKFINPETSSHANNSTENAWKLLVVDDEESVIYSISALLEGFRFLNRPITILKAGSVKEALTLVENHQDIAVALLDVIMEEEDSGLQIVRYIRANNADMRIILRTGHTKLSKLQTLLDYDVDGYLEKGKLGVDDIKSVLVTAFRSYYRIKQLIDEQKTNCSLLNKLEQLESLSFFGEFSHELYYHFQSQAQNYTGTHFDLIMRRLAKFSQLYFSKKGFRHQPLASLVESVVNQAQAKASDAGLVIHWDTSYSENIDDVLISRDTFGFAIKSIVENAVVFGCLGQQKEQTAHISVSVYIGRDNETIHIDITDNGKNKPHPKLCFVALHTSCASKDTEYSSFPSSEDFNFTKDHHVGLNLTIAQFCIMQHDGVISVNTSSSKTCFRVQIPINQKVLKSRVDENNSLREFSYFRRNSRGNEINE